MRQPPKVFLVGAGPGDPELLTVKARRLIEEADVLVYDRLVSAAVLALVPLGTAKIYVGKAAGDHPVPQHQINHLLVTLAREGRRVVRLKGGDPFLFGRGSEEAEALARNGIAYEVVPGITAASACTSAIGVPLTHRGLATGVRFVTGHCRADGELDFDWHGLADGDTTLVVYMGFANIRRIALELMVHGLAVDTPAAAIGNGTRPDQRHVVSRLDRIADEMEAADFEGPVLFVIGRVVAMAEVLAGRRPAAERAEPVLEEVRVG